jgi:hypothetical protein
MSYIVKPSRDAISRAYYFIAKANSCLLEEQAEHEAFLEAAIIFARTAVHRLQSKYENHPKWKVWWAELKNNRESEFFRKERDFILKEGPPKVGQMINYNPEALSKYLYYYEKPGIPASDTVWKYLDTLSHIVKEAEEAFTETGAEA